MLGLETERLILREFVPEDLDALAAVLCDPHTMRFYPAPLDRAGVLEWIGRNRRRYAERGYGLWAATLKSTGELIGDCGLTTQSVDGSDETEIGYAARACRDYGFAHLDADHLISLIRPENRPSRRVAEKMGMNLWKQIVWRELPHLVYVIYRADLPRLC